MEKKFICTSADLTDCCFGNTPEEAFTEYLAYANYPDQIENLNFFEATKIEVKLKLEICTQEQ